MGSRLLKLESFTRLYTKQTNSYNFIMGEEEIDMVGLFYKLANAEQEGKDATLDRKKITMALKALGISEEFKAEEVLASMDADNSGDIDLDEWTNCMTKELRIAIYRQFWIPIQGRNQERHELPWLEGLGCKRVLQRL